MAQDNYQSDLDWFDALSGKTDPSKATRLRNILREAELADAAQEDTSHDWQRLQFAMKREKAKPEAKHPRFKYYSMVASVFILVCATSVILATLREPGYTPTETAYTPIPLPPPVALAPPATTSPTVVTTHSKTEHAKVKAVAPLDGSKYEAAEQLMSRQRVMETMSERSEPMEELVSPGMMMAPPAATVATSPASETPRVAAIHDSSEQTVFTESPEQGANQLEAELAQLGVSVVKSHSEDRFILLIMLTYPVKTEVVRALSTRVIQVPEKGKLSVTFMKSTP